MIVISDTSCLCYLARLECAQVLEVIFGKVIVPTAVAAKFERLLALGFRANPLLVETLLKEVGE